VFGVAVKSKHKKQDKLFMGVLIMNFLHFFIYVKYESSGKFMKILRLV
jgi:hypothetical protein